MDGRGGKIFAIRGTIQKLEDVKDKVLRFWEPQKNMDVSTQNIFIGDAKEAYYTVVAAYELLDAASKGDKNKAESCKQFLNTAKSALELCASELEGTKSAEAVRLENELRTVHEQCRAEIFQQLLPFLGKKETAPPAQHVIQAGTEEYRLPCAVCSEIAVIFKTGVPEIEKENKLLYSGIAMRTYFSLEHAPKVFSLLQKDDIRGVHEYIIEKTAFREGVDGYCPDCDKIFCREHYNVQETFDEGFYDCSYGTCPSGHRRMIDD